MIQESNGSSGIWTFWLGFIGLTFWLGSSGIWTFWLGFIGLTFWLGFIGIWTFWLGFIGLTFWLGFTGNMDLLARVHRVDLGAWTRPPDRRWRITARGTWLAFRVLAAGAGKTTRDSQHQSAD